MHEPTHFDSQKQAVVWWRLFWCRPGGSWSFRHIATFRQTPHA